MGAVRDAVIIAIASGLYCCCTIDLVDGVIVLEL